MGVSGRFAQVCNVLGCRKIFDISQTEYFQSAQDFDRFSVQKHADDAACVDPANVFDITSHDRLLVGNDCQGFQDSRAQALRGGLDDSPDPLGIFRTGPNLVSAGHFDQIDTAWPMVVFVFKRLNGFFDGHDVG